MASGGNDPLGQYCIRDAPSSMFYISNFVTAQEEEYILSRLPANRWVSLSRRRLQAIPARLTATNTLVAASGLPEWLTRPIVARFADLSIFKDSPHGRANHCLINEYLPGQGIMPHEDGAAYHPVVATVSLGGSTVLDVTEKPATSDSIGKAPSTRKHWRVVQEPRSLLVTTGSAYRDTLHGIAEVTQDVDLNPNTVVNWTLLGDKESIVKNGGRIERHTRISLTYRDVFKESKLGAKIFGTSKT